MAWEPPHLLCRGYQRCKEGHGPASAVTGLQSFYPNEHVNRLKGPMWEAVLRLLGKDGERVMLDLLVNEALFLAVPSGFGNYLQMSGGLLQTSATLGEVDCHRYTSSGPKTSVGIKFGVAPEKGYD